MKLQKKNLVLFKNLVVIGVLLTTAYLFLNIPSNPLTLVTSPVFIPVVLVYIALYFAWQILHNKTMFVIEEIPNVVRERPKPRKMNRSKALLTFILASQILSVPFIILIMQQIAYSNINGTGAVISNWDHFGELGFETILFSIVSIIVFVGIFFNFRQWRSAE